VVGGVGANVIISGVTIRNGNGDPVLGHGGGIHVGNTAIGTSVTLDNVIVTACTATGANAGASGIDNSGTLIMNTVAVKNNDGPGGGVNNGAAGVLTWTNGEASGNFNSDIANAGGGGVQNNGTITLTNITISNNSSSGQGAGIDSIGTVAAQNVTVSNNTSTAAVNAIGGVRNNGVLTVTVRNTIISGNAPANCGGTITSQGNNLDSANSCLFAGLGDLINTDPLLVALANNGGALQTRALQPTSPAIDAGSATVCPPTDARGIVRPVDGNPLPPAVTAICDIGAFEFRPRKITAAPASPLNFGTVTTTTSDQVVTITNGGDGPLLMGTIAVADALAAPFTIPVNTCTPNLTLARAASCALTVRFTPVAVAAASDTFSIPSDDPLTPIMTFSVSGAGSATLVPNITITDSAAPANDQLVNFGSIAVGTTSDATITITGGGSTAVVIGTIAGNDPLAAPFSITSNTCSGQAIAPAQTCTLTVRFAPTTNAASSDTFDVPNNDPDTPTITITLTGSGLSATGNNPPSVPVLTSPANGATVPGTSVSLVWQRSTDVDGDAVTYHVTNCANAAFTGCTPVDVASAAPSALLFAGLGSFGAGIILVGFVAGSGLKRSRKTMLLMIALLLMGALFMSCSKSSDDGPPAPVETQFTVSGLAPGTPYFWKVVADDGKGGTSTSVTWSYTTQ